MRRSDGLIFASVVWIACMFALIPLLTRWWGPARGTLALFGLYWFCFCIPLGFVFQRREDRRKVLSMQIAGQRWVPWCVLGQCTGLIIAAWFLWPRPTPAMAFFWALPCALVNGFSEEFYWRGAFLAQANGSLKYQAWGVALFTLWHVPLLLAHGVSYHGPYVVVGGALLVGVFWAAIAARTQRIGWTIVSHIVTNIIAFVELISVNFLTAM